MRRSAGVSAPADGRRPPILASSARARAAHGSAPSASKLTSARSERLARGGALLDPAVQRAQTRAYEPSRREPANVRARRARARTSATASSGLAPRAREERAAAGRRCKRGRAVQCAAALLEPTEHRLGVSRASSTIAASASSARKGTRPGSRTPASSWRRRSSPRRSADLAGPAEGEIEHARAPIARGPSPPPSRGRPPARAPRGVGTRLIHPTLRGPDQRPDCEPERLLVTLPGLERELVPFVGEPRGLRPLPVVVRGHCRLGEDQRKRRLVAMGKRPLVHAVEQRRRFLRTVRPEQHHGPVKAGSCDHRPTAWRISEPLGFPQGLERPPGVR